MSVMNRRSLLASGCAVSLAACTGTATREGDKIDNRVDEAIAEMYRRYPNTQALVAQASGILVMPRVGEASLGYGGAYGEGALRIGGATVDYYSVAEASVGFQIGLKVYSSVLFFMSPDRLRKFRERDGWTMGADFGYTALELAETARIDSNTYKDSVFGVVFDQKGLAVGASLEGAKYTRIVR